MSTHELCRDENTGTTLQSVGEYDLERTPHGTYRWEHIDTGLVVELSKRTGMQDGYGNVQNGWAGRARPAAGEPAVDTICGCGGSYLPSKAQAYETVREWMQARPDGELTGDEEVEF